MDLFDGSIDPSGAHPDPGDVAPPGATRDLRDAPLAERMRPRTIEEIAGQETLLGPGRPLRVAIETDQVASLLLWGPPGSGKTTLARLIAERTRAANGWRCCAPSSNRAG